MRLLEAPLANGACRTRLMGDRDSAVEPAPSIRAIENDELKVVAHDARGLPAEAVHAAYLWPAVVEVP